MVSWTEEQIAHYEKRTPRSAVNNNAQTTATSQPEPPAKCPEKNAIQFTVTGQVVAKPRMTAADRWKKRPCVLRYRNYCDRIRAAAPKNLWEQDCCGLDIIAHIAVYPSWSKAKKASLIGQPHRARPDSDNILKALGDGLFKDDSGIWDVRCRKFWCADKAERTEVIVRFSSKSGS